MKQKLSESGPDLRKLREAAGVGQAAIAKEAGVNSGIIWFFENGKIQHPGKLSAILAAYAKLDELPKMGRAKEKTEKKKRGRPRKVQPDGDPLPVKEKAEKLKQKRPYAKRIAPPATPPVDPDLDADDGLDDCMKPQPQRGKPGPDPAKADPVDRYTADRLQDHIRSFVHDNDLTIVESGKTGRRSVVMPWEQLMELGAILWLQCGHNVR